MIDASYAVHISASGLGQTSVPDAVSLMTEGLTAPPIFWHEVANALRNMRLRRKISDPAAAAALRSLQAMRIVLEPATAEIQGIVTLSDQYQITIYDAAYLDHAIRSGSRLVTRDKGLFAAAKVAGVEVTGL